MKQEYTDTNQASWDQRTLEHVRSKFYDVEGFLAGACSLKEIERAELGDVEGKSLLHLQCHFGLDTLSFARRGASVTGLDLSPASIEQAGRLAKELQLDARFVAANVYDTLEHVDGPFDLVFTSYGAIEWLDDLKRWASIVAKSLKEGGCFHMVEFHPYSYSLQGDPYFHDSQPMRLSETSYTENAEAELPLYVWSHPISDVVNALVGAGLVLEHLNEFPSCTYDCFSDLVEKEPGRFYRSEGASDIPMLFSIKARKPVVGSDR